MSLSSRSCMCEPSWLLWSGSLQSTVFSLTLSRSTKGVQIYCPIPSVCCPIPPVYCPIPLEMLFTCEWDSATLPIPLCQTRRTESRQSLTSAPAQQKNSAPCLTKHCLIFSAEKANPQCQHGHSLDTQVFLLPVLDPGMTQILHQSHLPLISSSFLLAVFTPFYTLWNP